MKRILLCLDASPRAPGVLAAATDPALRMGARMCLLRTVGLPPELDQAMFVHAAADVVETMTARARASSQSFRRASLLGTTAGKVANHCERSVLVIRQPPGAAK